MIVLDCSVAIAWCFADEATAATEALLDRVRDQGAVVPALWPLEVGNVLAGAVRHGRLTAAGLAARVATLRDLPIETDAETAPRALSEILALAREHALTTYDAAYLELALRLALPLATLDRALLDAARRSGVACLPEAWT